MPRFGPFGFDVDPPWATSKLLLQSKVETTGMADPVPIVRSETPGTEKRMSQKDHTFGKGLGNQKIIHQTLAWLDVYSWLLYYP